MFDGHFEITVLITRFVYIFNQFGCSRVTVELKLTAVEIPQIPVFICFPVAFTKRCLTEFYFFWSNYPVPYLLPVFPFP